MNLIGPSAERAIDLIGVNPSSVRTSGTLLRHFSPQQLAKQHAIALPTPLASEIGAGPLQAVKLQIGARFVETLVGATITEANDREPCPYSRCSRADQLCTKSGWRAGSGQSDLREIRSGTRRKRTHSTCSARNEMERQSSTGPVRFPPVRGRRVATEPKRAAVLCDQRSSRVHVRIERHAHDRAITPRTDKRYSSAGREPLGHRQDSSIRCRSHRSARVRSWIGARRHLLHCRLSQHPKLSRSCFPDREQPNHNLAKHRRRCWRRLRWRRSSESFGRSARSLLARCCRRDPAAQITGASWTAARLIVGRSSALRVTTMTLIADTKAALIGNIALVAALVILLPLLFDILRESFQSRCRTAR